MRRASKIAFFTQVKGWGTSLCRAEKIAEELGVPCDPPVETITREHIIVMVKTVIPEAVRRAGKAYCDIIDGSSSARKKLQGVAGVDIIAMTPQCADEARKLYPDRKVIWLPHQHCNDERRIRPRRAVSVIGYNGSPEGFPLVDWKWFAGMAEDAGFKVVRQYDTVCRKRLCEFYLGVDIAVSFRDRWRPMKGPAKLNNAASFGIPTVAKPEPSFLYNYTKRGHFMPAQTITEMVNACILLRANERLYDKVANKAWRDAQKYHISKVVRYYRYL